MSITRKPKSAAMPALIDVEALINKGGSVPKPPDNAEKDSTVAVVLRIPADVLSRVDAAVKARSIRTPRHTWLLEAVHEKLQRIET